MLAPIPATIIKRVHPHQIVEVSVFRVGLFSPLFAAEAVDPAAFLCVFIPVGTGEKAVVPDKIGVFAVPARESEAGPGSDGLFIADLFAAVFR